MKKYFFAALIAALTACGMHAQTVDYTTDEVINADTALYSRLIINSCLYHFKANTSPAGFAKYDAAGTLEAKGESERGFDYVPGLVAKAVIECVDFYANEADLSFMPEEERTFYKPWFYSISNYGNCYYNGNVASAPVTFPKDKKKKGVPNVGRSLDDMNATKLYFGLKSLTATGGTFADATTYANCNTALGRATKGLLDHNNRYAISSATSQAFFGDETFTGGWFHKDSYDSEMWCDGQYMGPALLAELIHDGRTLEGFTVDQCWDLVAKQLEMTWTKLWVPETQLLRHAFSAKPASDAVWANQDQSSPLYGVSQEYWGRACGWYFLALVDILELMPTDNPHYATLKGYLESLAAGLAARQDANTHCWYQLLQYNAPASAPTYQGNYVESSATAIFVATYLKAMRLNLLPRAQYEQVAKDGFHGFLKQFLAKSVGDGNPYALIHNCASAGLGGSDNRAGDANYYINGKDVTQTNTYTEGKVLGAFILAATEYERAYTLPNLRTIEESTCHCLTVTLQ